MDTEKWMDAFTQAVLEAFGERVCCVGLQGSLARGEAGPDGDIDVVVILDAWHMEDWPRYEAVLESLPARDKVCGFVSGWEELLHWEPSELFGFYYDTRVWYGSLAALRERFGPSDARRAVRIGACGIYHMCVHNRLHEKSGQLLRELYKSAFFVLRAVHFCRTGAFVVRRSELLPLLQGEERLILTAGMPHQEGTEPFAIQSERLLQWAGSLIRSYT